MKIAVAMLGLTLLAVFAAVTYWQITRLGRRDDSDDAKAEFRRYSRSLFEPLSPATLPRFRVTDRERRLIRVVWLVAWSAMAATILVFLFILEP